MTKHFIFIVGLLFFIFTTPFFRLCFNHDLWKSAMLQCRFLVTCNRSTLTFANRFPLIPLISLRPGVEYHLHLLCINWI